MQINVGIYATKQLHVLDVVFPVLDAAYISATKVTQGLPIIDVACSIVGCTQIGASIGCSFYFCILYASKEILGSTIIVTTHKNACKTNFKFWMQTNCCRCWMQINSLHLR